MGPQPLLASGQRLATVRARRLDERPELHVSVGVRGDMALVDETLAADRVHHGERERGIGSGERADLAVLDADPLADISAIRRTRYVVTNGRMYEPAALWRLASFRPAARER